MVRGCLWPGVADVVKHASADEVEKEITAQLNRALNLGFKPTHLDSHMGTLFASPQFLERYIKLGIENNIPVMLPGGHNSFIQKEIKANDERINQLRTTGKLLWSSGLPVLDDLHNESYDWKIDSSIKNDDKRIQAFKTKKYIEAIKSLKTRRNNDDHALHSNK